MFLSHHHQSIHARSSSSKRSLPHRIYFVETIGLGPSSHDAGQDGSSSSPLSRDSRRTPIARRRVFGSIPCRVAIPPSGPKSNPRTTTTPASPTRSELPRRAGVMKFLTLEASAARASLGSFGHGDQSGSESSLTAAPRSDCATIHPLVRFFRYPAGFRNFIPKHAFTRYCWLTTDSLVKRDHGPPGGGRYELSRYASDSLARLGCIQRRLGP
jgi:hypothetical protein